MFFLKVSIASLSLSVIVSTLKYLIFLNSRFLLNKQWHEHEGVPFQVPAKSMNDRNETIMYNIGISKVKFGMFRNFVFYKEIKFIFFRYLLIYLIILKEASTSFTLLLPNKYINVYDKISNLVGLIKY